MSSEITLITEPKESILLQSETNREVKNDHQL